MTPTTGWTILTGATGALGSFLLHRLTAAGHRTICLVRPRAGLTGAERLASKVGQTDGVVVVDGDITSVACGLENARWPYPIDRIVHSAASIRFTDAHAALTANVTGLHNVLTLAERLGVKEFHHISTAYVAGDARSFTEVDRYIGQRWRNAYEQTKFMGEEMVRAWAAVDDRRRFSIYRPSILIGCEDGSTPSYDGYYGYFRPIFVTGRMFRRQTNRPTGEIDVPLVICSSPRDPINLAPIDWAADMITGLVGREPEGKTYHVVHPSPTRVRLIIEWTIELLGIRGVVFTENVAQRNAVSPKMPPLSILQTNLNARLDPFLPYVSNKIDFSMDQLRADLGPHYRNPIPVDKTLLVRMLEYAIAHNWGIQGGA